MKSLVFVIASGIALICVASPGQDERGAAWGHASAWDGHGPSCPYLGHLPWERLRLLEATVAVLVHGRGAKRSHHGSGPLDYASL